MSSKMIRYVLASVLVTATAGIAVAQEEPSQPPQQQQQQSPQGQQKQGKPMEVVAARMSAKATVDKVNPKNRELTVRTMGGDQFNITVPQQVSNFDQIKKGQQVQIEYYTSVALSLVSKQGKQPGTEMSQMEERVPAPLPSGISARKITEEVVVQKVDNNKLTIRTPDGATDTVQVTDPEMQTQLSNLKKGDKLKLTYAEAVAITVQPQQQSQNEAKKQPNQEGENPQEIPQGTSPNTY